MTNSLRWGKFPQECEENSLPTICQKHYRQYYSCCRYPLSIIRWVKGVVDVKMTQDGKGKEAKAKNINKVGPAEMHGESLKPVPWVDDENVLTKLTWQKTILDSHGGHAISTSSVFFPEASFRHAVPHTFWHKSFFVQDIGTTKYCIFSQISHCNKIALL